MTANGTTAPKGKLPFVRPEKTTTLPELAERFMTANNDGASPPLAADEPHNATPISLVLNITASFSVQFHDSGSISCFEHQHNTSTGVAAAEVEMN
ncbi:hypothetical protein P8452_08275 [Trifolium repens]|nr:hypothetical protein P8452_08275 [Trifolium repens]